MDVTLLLAIGCFLVYGEPGEAYLLTIVAPENVAGL